MHGLDAIDCARAKGGERKGTCCKENSWVRTIASACCQYRSFWLQLRTNLKCALLQGTQAAATWPLGFLCALGDGGFADSPLGGLS